MGPIPEALELFENGKVTEAVELLMTEVSQVSEQEQFAIGELLHSWGFLNEAASVFNDLLTANEDDHEVKFMLADIYIDLEEDEKALQLIEDIDPEDPDYVRALVVLADIYEQQGLYEVSEQKLLQAQRIAPKNEAIDLALAELYFHVGDFSNAIYYYEKVKHLADQFPFVNIQERLAESYSSIGKWEEALEQYKQLDLEHPDELFKYGYTAFQLKRFDIAIKVWEDLIKYDKDYTSVYPYLAQAYEEEGLIKEANNVLKNGLQFDEYNIELYMTLAKNEIKLKRIDEAKSYLKEAIALDPGYEDAIEQLITLYFSHDEFEEAKDLIEELMKFKPYPNLLDWRLAQVYEELELFDKANTFYEKAALVFNNDPSFQKEYGFFLVEEGKYKEAKQLLQSYLKSHPEDEDVYDYLNRLIGEDE